jgi:hypothetical protein
MIALSTIKDLFKNGTKPRYIFSEFFHDHMEKQGIQPEEYYEFLEDMGYEIRNAVTFNKLAIEDIGKRDLDIVAIALD